MGSNHIQYTSIVEPIGRSTLEKTYKIQKPNGNHDWPTAREFLEIIDGEAFSKAQENYLSWDELRNKDWAMLDTQKLWWALKMSRIQENMVTPITDTSGAPYKFDEGRHVAFLHDVTLELGGNMLGISDFDDGDKKQIIRRNLIEESIASSKLEGANTSREAARRMLGEGRKPRDKDERMIVNNHAAMTWIEETAKNKRMSVDLLLDLHRQVTSGTLSDATLEGKLRETLDASGNRLKIMPWDETTVVYIAPDKGFVEEQLPRLIKFANDEDGSPFIHPLIKAIMLHFWIGLLHPFEDGNGRLARIIFYWYMLRKGYWAFAYMSLSERILKSPKQYAMAYVNTEQDDYDLNYFIQYNIEKLILARQHLQVFLGSKISENRERAEIFRGGHGLNLRQIKLLQQLSQSELQHTSVAEHHASNSDIGYISAVSDLKTLVEKGFLKKQKNGRNVIYLPTDKLNTLIR
jgi:Fic family protein